MLECFCFRYNGPIKHHQPIEAAQCNSDWNAKTQPVPQKIQHNVLIVGCNDTNPRKKYWIVQNSWGEKYAKSNAGKQFSFLKLNRVVDVLFLFL